MSEQIVHDSPAPGEEDLTDDVPPGPWDGLRLAAPALALGLSVIGLLFREEISASVRVWIGSTAYGHCFFVLPIAFYLAWDRRHSLVGRMPQPLPWLGLLALPLGVAWFGAERLGLTEGRELVVITLVELLFLAVLGWRFFWALSAPLLYLYFLVPFGAFLTPKLQEVTAHFIPFGLTLVGVPFYMDAFKVEIAEGSFYVAEACAGLRFLIASVAFGVLYSLLIYRTPWKRGLFMLASIVIPVIANGFRAFGIVWLGHLLGSAEAAAADHIIYGWLFFSFVTVLLILAGIPFREDEQHIPPTAPDADPRDAGLRAITPPLRAAALLAVLAAAGPAGAWTIESRVAPPQPAPMPQFVVPQNCTAQPAVAISDGMSQMVTCAGVPLTVSVRVLPPRINPNRILAAWRTLTGEDTASDTEFDSIDIPGHSPEHWRLTTTEEPGWVTASVLWLNGASAGGGLRDRATQARASIFGASSAPVLASVSFHSGRVQALMGEREAAEKAIRGFLAAQTDLGAQITALAIAAAK